MANFWKAIGGDTKKLFHFMASPKGQAVIGIAELGVEEAFPPAAAIINIVNFWGHKAFEIEGLAEAAQESDGNGAVKAEMVMDNIVPKLMADFKAAGLAIPDETSLLGVNDRIVQIIQILSGQTKVVNATPVISGNTGIAGTTVLTASSIKDAVASIR